MFLNINFRDENKKIFFENEKHHFFSFQKLLRMMFNVTIFRFIYNKNEKKRKKPKIKKFNTN